MGTTRPHSQAADPRPMLVGREAELGVVAAFLRRGGPAASGLILQGEAGIGKTAIVRAALQALSSAGTRVLFARPGSAELELPYAGLGDLLEVIELDELATLADPQRLAIGTALGLEGLAGPVDRHALSRGVLELLRQASSRDSLVVVIDDVQWLDGPTSFALGFALRRLASSPIRALLAMRTTVGPPAELPLGLDDWRDVGKVVVGPMSATDLGAVVRHQLGGQLPRPELEALREASGGNPMFALELARLGFRPGEATAPRTLPEALDDRLRGMDDQPRSALTFAAAALHPTIDLLVGAGVTPSAIRSALLTGLLVAEGQRLSFAHPLLGAAAYGLLLPDERRSVHALLAEASTDLVERGHHLSRALVDRDERGSDALALSARHAASLGDHAAAAGFLLRSASLLDPADARVGEREVDAADQLLLAGDVERGTDLASRLVDELPGGALRARARMIRANGLVGGRMTYEENYAELILALAEAVDDPGVAATVHLELAELAAGMLQLARSVEHLHAAMALAGDTGIQWIHDAALGSLGLVECLLGRGVTDAAIAAFASWDRTISSINTYTPRMSLAEALLYAGDFREAERLYLEEVETSEAQGVEVIEVMARVHLAEVQVRAGNWTAALANARLGLEHARQAADDQVITGAAYGLGMVEALLGDLGTARSRASTALAAAEASGDFWHITFNRSVLGLVELSGGDPGAAIAVLEPAWSAIIASELGDLSVFPVGHVLGEALAAVGRLDDAAAVVGHLRASAGGARPWSRGMASRLDALIASARGDHGAARAAIASALTAHAELPEPFEHARTIHIAGRVESRARNWGAARAALVDALERFDQLGAARWAERAAADLARLPGRRSSDKHALTEREREVAELAAAGHSNKEITARLFLSERTIESHLSKAYEKLGVRSRAALARRLGRLASE